MKLVASLINVLRLRRLTRMEFLRAISLITICVCT